MIDDTALASLQRSLGEYRAAKRKTKSRLAEIEAESEMLRSQMATIDAIIEQTELALRKVLFPADSPSDRELDQSASAQDVRAQFNQSVSGQSGRRSSYKSNYQSGA